MDNYISINDVIARTKMQLHLGNTTEWDNYFAIVINEGLLHLNCLSLVSKRNETITVEDHKAMMPKGFYKLLGLRTATIDTTTVNVDVAITAVPGVNTITIVPATFTTYTFVFTQTQTTGLTKQNTITFTSGADASGTIVMDGIKALFDAFGFAASFISTSATVGTITAAIGAEVISIINILNVISATVTKGVYAHTISTPTAVVSRSRNCSQQIYIDKAFLNTCGCEVDNTFRPYSESFQFNNGVIYFDTSREIDEAEIAFLGFNVDENGFIKIREDYERALTNYAAYQFTLSYPEKYNAGIIDRYYAVWRSQKSWIKGEDFKADWNKNKLQIKRLFNATMVNKDLLMVNQDFI